MVLGRKGGAQAAVDQHDDNGDGLLGHQDGPSGRGVSPGVIDRGTSRSRGRILRGSGWNGEDVLVSTVHCFKSMGGLLPYVLCPAAPSLSSCAAAVVTPGQQEVESHGCRDPTGLDRETAGCGNEGIDDARGSDSPHGRGS